MEKTQKLTGFPPEHLSPGNQAVWIETAPRIATTTGRRMMLQAALEAQDMSTAAREARMREGLTLTGPTGQVHIHPLLKIEIEARRQFTTIWARLGLANEPLGRDEE